MSAPNINDLLQIWATTLPPGQSPPFINKQDMYSSIDAIEDGNAPWASFSISFNGEIEDSDMTPWKRASYEVWYRDPKAVLHNQLKSQDFANEMDYAPKEVRDDNGRRHYMDFMSGDWAWRQAVSAINLILFL